MKSFIETLEIDNFDILSCEVYKELQNIDILLLNEDSAIIIENKIFAEDQKNQLQRYYDYISRLGKYSNIYIYYLTLDGKEPSENSIGSLKMEDIKRISYKFEINDWIRNCIEISSTEPLIRETLVQYKNLINELTGGSMNNEEIHEILALISEDHNVIKAHKIAQNWIHVKWFTEFNFWNDLLVVIEKEYKVLDIQKYSSKALDGVIHKSKNRWPWYGIIFKIGEYKGLNFGMFIERGWDNVYYRFVLTNEVEVVAETPENDEIGELLNGFYDDPSTDYNYLKPEINFEAFSGEQTLLLNNKVKRNEYIINQWNHLKEIIEQAKNKVGLKF